MAPLLTTRLLQVALADVVTAAAPVVAITTLSPATGTTPPTQVEAVDHVPPVAVLVIVAAFTFRPMANSRTIPKAKTEIFFKLIFIFRRY